MQEARPPDNRADVREPMGAKLELAGVYPNTNPSRGYPWGTSTTAGLGSKLVRADISIRAFKDYRPKSAFNAWQHASN